MTSVKSGVSFVEPKTVGFSDSTIKNLPLRFQAEG
jgi:hypothetical protein